MGQKVIIAPSARRDPHDIVQEIAHDAPGRAVAFGNALLDRAEQAGISPRSGRVVPEFGRDDVPEPIHDPIRIIYRLPHADADEVIRFWHVKRGTPEI